MYVEHIGYKTDGYFVEVGAFDGVLWSNTSGLLDAGWTGVYFEPQSYQFTKLSKNLGQFSNATLINKAISDFHGSTRLYLGGSVSTIDHKMRDNYIKMPAFGSTGIAEGNTEVVQVSTLDTELQWLDTPIGFDVLVIDVEGAEMAVLNGFSIHKWLPKMVIIEAHEEYPDPRLSDKSQCINNYMDDFSYEKIYSDHINNIYVYNTIEEAIS
jgi:FkbM family methyltransferase